jgi:hypothetical protein
VRRHISVSETFYARITAAAAARGVTRSELVDQAFDLPHEPDPQRYAGRRGKKRTPRIVGGPRVVVSEGTYEMLQDQVVRARELDDRDTDMSEVLDDAINRALDTIEKHGWAPVPVIL